MTQVHKPNLPSTGNEGQVLIEVILVLGLVGVLFTSMFLSFGLLTTRFQAAWATEEWLVCLRSSLDRQVCDGRIRHQIKNTFLPSELKSLQLNGEDSASLKLKIWLPGFMSEMEIHEESPLMPITQNMQRK